MWRVQSEDLDFLFQPKYVLLHFLTWFYVEIPKIDVLEPTDNSFTLNGTLKGGMSTPTFSLFSV